MGYLPEVYTQSAGLESKHQYQTRHRFHDSEITKGKENIVKMHVAVNLFNLLSDELKKKFKEEDPKGLCRLLKGNLRNNPTTL